MSVSVYAPNLINTGSVVKIVVPCSKFENGSNFFSDKLCQLPSLV